MPAPRGRRPRRDHEPAVECGALHDPGRPDLPVGEHDGVGRDEPEIEGLVAQIGVVERRTSGLADRGRELVPMLQERRLVDTHRSDDVQLRADRRGPARCERRDRSIEALVGLDEPDRHEHEPIQREAQDRPSRDAVGVRVRHEAGTVCHERGPLIWHRPHGEEPVRARSPCGTRADRPSATCER